jgi:predicted nucleotidyltransferase
MLHMTQISYDILEQLLKKDNHIRGIAKSMNTNQMTVSRRIKELENQNIVDFRQEGKNKVYFLKDTIEKNEILKMLEHHKLIEIITKKPIIRKVVGNIRDNKKIKLAILFGSYAKGNETKESDIDLYIETQDRNLKKEITLINSKLSVKIGKFDKTNLLVKEIIKNHIIITGVDRYYELIH